MRVVVSGVNGFVGRHLVRELSSAGHEVAGLGLGPSNAQTSGLLAEYVDVDLTRQWPDLRADAVVHLAALSAVGPSFAEPQRYIESNSAPMTRLGELVLGSEQRPRLVVISTGAVYGSPGGRPLREGDSVVPTSPYVVSKLVTEAQCAYYRRRGLDVVVMRPFNHIGPGQGSGFVLPDLVAGVKAWRESSNPVVVGNLDTRRDYTDVRDVVRAYRSVLESRAQLPAVMNVCSGSSRSGRDLLEAIAAALDIDVPEVRVDASRVRPEDPPMIIGDNALLGSAVGWRPKIDLATTVADVLTSAEPTDA